MCMMCLKYRIILLIVIKNREYETPRTMKTNFYIISEETSIFAPQRLPFYKVLGVAACTVGKVQASTVFMCVCSTFRSSFFFTIRQKRIRGGSTYAECNSGH